MAGKNPHEFLGLVCPSSGSGVHSYLYAAACRAVDAGMTDEEAAPLIAATMTRPPSPAQEVEHALGAARGERKPTTQWPGRNLKLIQKIFATPKPNWKPLDISADDAIDILFPGNPLLCIGKSSSIFSTMQREAFRKILWNKSLIVPSPMTGRQGRTQEGHWSEHSLDNTGPRRFIVIEFDWGDQDNQMKLLAHLARKSPLCCVTFSGSKSLHGWFYCQGKDEEKLLKWMKYAVSIGADFRTWLRSQFVRLPGGRRDNGAHQPILFLDPKKVKDYAGNTEV